MLLNRLKAIYLNMLKGKKVIHRKNLAKNRSTCKMGGKNYGPIYFLLIRVK